jgi:glycosyltransferase involved in cell wall biosynthesis
VNILHITSDWKWTGSASPMLELLLAQRERGDEAEFVCASPPDGADGSLREHAIAVGVAPVLEIGRGRGVKPWRDRGDLKRLRNLFTQHSFDVVHAWHTRDHLLVVAAASASRRSGCTRLVRSYPSAVPIADRPWNRWLFGRASDGLLCVSPGAAARNAGLCRGGAVAGAFGAVDLDRFRPGPRNDALRARLGLASEQRVLGVVARVQAHRRFDLLFAAVAPLLRAEPLVQLLVVGRGTRIDALAKEPARRLGIENRVVFAGYRRDDYAEVLRCIDVFTLLVPGSDGGCRALLEAAASGIPAVTTARGALPEIVIDGETGLVVEEEAQAFTNAWGCLLRDSARCAEMGAAARRRAESEFSRTQYAETVDRLYRAL